MFKRNIILSVYFAGKAIRNISRI